MKVPRIGDDAAVQGHAVHAPRPCRTRARRSGRSGRRRSGASKAVMPLTKVLLEPVRSAEPPTISGMAGIRCVQRRARVHAGGVGDRLGRASLGDIGVERLEGVGGQVAVRMTRARTRPCVRLALQAGFPGLAARLGAAARRPRARACEDVVGHRRSGSAVQPMASAGGGDLGVEQGVAVAVGVAFLGPAPLEILVLQAIRPGGPA